MFQVSRVPTPMRLAVAALAVLALSSCSLFGDRSEDLRFETLVQDDVFLPADDETLGVLVVLQSEQDEMLFRLTESAAPFPRAIDYRREAVVGYAVPALVSGSRVTISRVTHEGDEVRIEAFGTGRTGVPFDTSAVAVAVPAHFVIVPAIGDPIRNVLASYRPDLQP